ncbi:LLM class flavin-dependent oxidoreductase [Nigerium massiliense]|uniref:LLM class flavin-dependent oxidoreductase n=1 Tax=Nigerium massiliense TaxID=1522317 RepID=UPI000A6CCD0A|nr:LLM class flavin-dependent oxidoreductase [Nigerium massiliense]
MSLKLSVLDLIPVRTGQTTGQALAAAVRFAQTADEAGYHRLWVAEHHNAAAIASTSPPVIIAMLASATGRIRVGSGGVMLPNHAPLAVAEQFALLEAAYPDRIDLGIGRAPGTDPVTSWALRSAAGPEGDPVEHFPEYVQQVETLLSPEGATFRIGLRNFDIKATAKAVDVPDIWLLGSSDYSARLAAEKGLPYVFAHHFAGRGTAEALALYREGFRGEGQPRTFLTANVVVGQTAEDAARLAKPYQMQMAALRTGQPMRPMLTVEQAETAAPVASDELLRDLSASWYVGTAEQVADGLRALAAEFDVDEVMVHPVTAASDADPLDQSPARERGLTALADALR